MSESTLKLTYLPTASINEYRYICLYKNRNQVNKKEHEKSDFIYARIARWLRVRPQR